MMNAEMVIDFLPISKKGDYVVYEVKSRQPQQNYSSFVICSVASQEFEPPAEVTGTINGAAITLATDGKPLPYRLRMGNKSINQLRLWQSGYHIPDTVVLDFSVFDAFKREGKIDLQDIYNRVIADRLGPSLAVRCSSNLEDSDAQSFAGTFDTYLDVPNQLDEVQGKIVQSYQKFCLRGDSQEETLLHNVRLSFMVQEMIQPTYSGFLFTLDPVNPPSDWLKIEYWQGPRENSQGFSISLNRETGKRVRSGRDNNRAPLPIIIQEKLHRAAVKLEHHFGTPQDIEFLISGTDDSPTLYLVQSRPITAFSYTPGKIRVDEQQKLSDILHKNQILYNLDPVLSSTNILELFSRAIPLGYSIFKYGFAGTAELEGGISIGRSRLGYARLDPQDGANLFYTVADQARTNLIVDALTFRLPGISKSDYLDIFVKHYLEQIKLHLATANYPEDGLYLQTDDPARWLEIAGARGEHLRAEFAKFLHQVIQVHAPNEYREAAKFFQQNDRLYRSYLDRSLHTALAESLRQEIYDLLSYLRTTFCPQYVVYARLAFLCTHVAKMRLSELLKPPSRFTPEQVLNELLRGVTIPTKLEGTQYPEFERLYKMGRITLAELIYRFQHIGSLDISQPRLGEYSLEKLSAVFGQSHAYRFDSEHPNTDNTDYTSIDITGIEIDNDPTLQSLYTNGGRFMRLRERAKGELLKLLWVLKRRFTALARIYRVGDLIYYLELDEALTIGTQTREELRLLAVQRKAYLEECRHHRVKNVLTDLRSTPFEKKAIGVDQARASRHRFARGKTIFYGHAEGYCLTASSNEEFIDKLDSYRAKNIEPIVGVFKGIEPSYFNVSALVGFATESGGYLSHAATVAREFRLPYISGIRFDKFRDEDYVTLDTENEQVIIRQR
jgi:phosphohistidine swiveling domain-containing protein